MRSPNKFRLKYLLEYLYNAVTKLFTCVKGLENENGSFAENASPSSENAKVEQNGSPEKSSFAFERR